MIKTSQPLKMAAISALALGGSNFVQAQQATGNRDPSSDFQDFMDTSDNVTSVHKEDRRVKMTNQESTGYYDRIFSPIDIGGVLPPFNNVLWGVVFYAEPIVAAGFTTDTFAVERFGRDWAVWNPSVYF